MSPVTSRQRHSFLWGWGWCQGGGGGSCGSGLRGSSCPHTKEPVSFSGTSCFSPSRRTSGLFQPHSALVFKRAEVTSALFLCGFLPRPDLGGCTDYNPSPQGLVSFYSYVLDVLLGTVSDSSAAVTVSSFLSQGQLSSCSVPAGCFVNSRFCLSSGVRGAVLPVLWLLQKHSGGGHKLLLQHPSGVHLHRCLLHRILPHLHRGTVRLGGTNSGFVWDVSYGNKSNPDWL